MELTVLAFVFGIIACVFTFVTGICFNNIISIIVCLAIIGALFLFYGVAVFVFSTKGNSRDLTFSYAVSAACMTVAFLMAASVITNNFTSPACSYKFRTCTQYVFGSIFGFLSVIMYAITAVIAFKAVHIF